MADPAKNALQRIETKKRGLFKKFAKRVRTEKNTTYRIFVEGNDNMGKSTACKKIYNYFTELGLSVKLISFPDYNTETGALIKKIYSEYSIDERHPEMDMYLHKANVREVLFNQVGKDKEEYDVIIFDRSPISNFLYHASLPFHSKYTVYSSEEKQALAEYLFEQYERICGDDMKIFYFNNRLKVVDKLFIMYGKPPVSENPDDREYDLNDTNLELQKNIRNICEFIDKTGYDNYNTRLYNEFYLTKTTMSWDAKGRRLSNASLLYSVLYSLFFDELTAEL